MILVRIMQTNWDVVLVAVLPIPDRQPEAQLPKQQGIAPQLCITRNGTAVLITSGSSEYKESRVSGIKVTTKESAMVQTEEARMAQPKSLRILSYFFAP